MTTQEHGRVALSVERRLSDGRNPLDLIEWQTVDARAHRTGDDQKDLIKVEAPSTWSQMAINIAASKYLKRSASINEGAGETSIRALIERVVDTISNQGVKQGYFDDETRGIFRDELCHILIHQMGAFNSPVYFNCGLMEAYGLSGTNVTNHFWDAKAGKPAETQDYYGHPQLSACFIMSIKDDLKDIWEHVGREMKVFKGGSGVGVSFSPLRSAGESLSTGGTSSGVISFLEVFDKAAGSTKSGGTSRRAAKMVILDADHPEILDFIRWKAREEEKAKMLIAAGLPSDFNGEAYHTVSGQNSNNTVRLTDEFMESLMRGGSWDLKSVTTGGVVRTVKAEDLFREICDAAWQCADPGLQFDTTINSWHTCPKSGRINASNPCSEVNFLDDSACCLASTNLTKFISTDGSFDVATFKHVCRMLTVALDIIVDYSAYPTEEICRNSHNFRPIGLGYTNLGAMLMRMALPYDSDRGRAVASTITAIMTAASYGMSAELAEIIGPFTAFKQNRTPMLAVISKHARKATNPTYEKMCPEYLMDAAAEMWEETVAAGKKFGFRNAQTTLTAPAGTISFMMDCDTTGIEPEFALVKEKMYAGGGTDKIVNRSVESALVGLGYSTEQVRDIIVHINGAGRLKKMGDDICEKRLLSIGFDEDTLVKVNDKIRTSRTLGQAFSNTPEAISIVREIQDRFDIDAENEDDPLERMGFSREEIDAANIYSCGHMGIETAPHLRPEHLPIFDCASACGIDGTRFIAPQGHVKMMAAIQPFISGASSKCVTGETLVPTDGGMIRISSLHQGEEYDEYRPCVISVATETNPKTTESFYYGGFQSVRSIQLRNGLGITGTHNHPILCGNEHGTEWRTLEDVSVGDYVAIKIGSDLWSDNEFQFEGFKPSESYGSQKTVVIPTTMTDDLAWLIGLYAAEGNTTKTTWTICIAHSDTDILNKANEVFDRCFGVTGKIILRDDRCPSLRVASKTICEFFGYIGVGRISYEKMIPNAILRSTRSHVLSFLSGLYFDGYLVCRNTPVLGIILNAKSLICDLQVVLQNLGVMTSQCSKIDAVTQKTYYGLYASGKNATMLSSLLQWDESHKMAEAERWATLPSKDIVDPWDVIPHIDRKSMYYALPKHVRKDYTFLLDPRTKNVSLDVCRRIKQEGYDLPPLAEFALANDVHFIPVKMAEDVGTGEVFDISVPESMSFIANGIVSHNTVNIPNDATGQDIWDIFISAWQQGLKCITIYRDGCKGSQPLTASGRAGEEDSSPLVIRRRKPPTLMTTGKRRKLTMNGYTIYVHAYHDEDTGKINEIWIDTKPGGGILDGFLNAIAKLVSTALQYGIPMEEIIQKFAYSSFDPSGNVTHPKIKKCKSLLDLVFRTIAVDFLGDDTYADNPEAEMMPSPQPVAQQEISGSRHHEIIICIQCGSDQVLKTGTCYTCPICGTTTGCA